MQNRRLSLRRAKMRVLDAAQMYSAEKIQNEEGITFTRLMENAGSACARAIMNRYKSDKKVCVLCGTGKNGGDGFVIARKLSQAGYKVCLVMAFGEPKAQDAIYMREQLDIMSTVQEFIWGVGQYKLAIEKADLLVDCIFGIGYRYREDEKTQEIFNFINSLKKQVVAIDIPSGCECDSDIMCPCAIKADMTVAISCLKPIHVFKPSCLICGDVVTVNIGLSDEIVENVSGEKIKVLTKSDAKSLFPKRDLMGNKGTFGKVISICGSKNMQGAAVLAAQGALRVGAGLVTACFPESAYCAIAPKLTEQLMLPMPSNLQGTFSSAAIPLLKENIASSNAVLLGCGMGLNLETKDIVAEIVKDSEKPLIIDADGINAISSNIDILKNKKAPILLTPHPGEFARLISKSIDDINANRAQYAKNFAKEYGVVLLLKGANTIIASPEKDEYYVNVTGNEGMAKGGSGDLLSGIILGLCAQGLSLYDAAVLGTYLHGKAGDMARSEFSSCGMTASDCADMLKKLLKDYE